MHDRPVDRRRFFREGLRELLKPLANAIVPIERALKEFETLANETPAPGRQTKGPQYDLWLRPPGALFPDQSFRDTCSRCGKCVEVCPAQCIKIDPAGNKGHGAPYIEPNVMACVVCEGLKCMNICPSGALQPIPLVDIDMGTAVWNYETCLRKNSEHCQICVDVCPVGSMAIELVANTIMVHEDGCIGCGVCQQQCPTAPKSIAVVPRKVWEETQT
jgi:MauM/NapG family ferredoxin protein